MSYTDLWIALRNRDYSTKAVAVILGHAKAESDCECDYVQGDFTVAHALSKTYTVQVDEGAIDRGNFARYGPNGGGYGLVQWTSPTRKLGLYDTAKRLGVSIGSEKAAVEWLDAELHQPEYAAVLATLKSDRSIREISDVFMHRFEKPEDQSDDACAYRASLAQAIYDELGGDEPSPPSAISPMEQNIQFAFVTKDGKKHLINVDGVCTIIDAVFELASSIHNGDVVVDPKDIVQIIDIPG